MRPLGTQRLLPRLALFAVAMCAVLGCDQENDPQRPPINTKLSDFGSGKKDSKNEKEKEKEKNKALGKSDEQVQVDALEIVSKNLDKQKKAAEEAIKKGPQADAKKEKKKEDKKDILTPKVFANGSTPFTELTFNPKDKHPQKSISLNPQQSGPTTITETVGRGKNSKDSAGAQSVQRNGTAAVGDDITLGKGDEKEGLLQHWFGKPKPQMKIVREGPAGTQFEIMNEKANKKKLGQVYGEQPDGTSMGANNKPDTQKLREIYNPFGKAAGKEELPSRATFVPASAEKQGLVTDRVAGEMLRIEAKKEADRRAKSELAGKVDGPKPLLGNNASGRHPLTDFEPAPNAKKDAPTSAAPAPASNPGVAAPLALGAAASFNANDNAPITADSPINSNFNPGKFAAPENASKDTPETKAAPAATPASDSDAAVAESQKQIGSLGDYRKGLATRDIVAREAAFQRAASEKRQDAIPALVEEVARNGMLAVTAARVLAVIGMRDDYIERGLMSGLNSNGTNDAALREACAETLGELRVRRAVPLLIEKAKLEKNFSVRAACVAALGVIGDESAVTTLHMKLDDRGEIEFVKQSAALALARFGDPAGREHLLQSLESQVPAYQILGLTGLAQLNDPRSPGYLISALDSRFDEVWTTAVMLFPYIGARSALTLLHAQIQSGNDVMRLRASLALGFLGCADGVPLICRATRSGSLQERAMGCELLARLGRTDQIPLLISKLSDPNTQVRTTAASALVRLDAKDAVPALSEAARGRFKSQLIQPVRLNPNEPDKGGHDTRSILSVQLGTPQDMNERMIMLACLRALRGEKDNFVLNTLPNSRDSSWPEFDRELLKQQVDMIKMFKLVEVVPSSSGASGAMIQVPGSPEVLYRKGEVVAGGFKVTEISSGAPSSDPTKPLPPFVSLLRGDERVILYIGQAPEVENIRSGVK